MSNNNPCHKLKDGVIIGHLLNKFSIQLFCAKRLISINGIAMVFVMKLAAIARKYKPRPKKEWTETALKYSIAESEKNNVLIVKICFNCRLICLKKVF